MFGISACFRIGAIAMVTALSAVPIIARYPSLSILRARFVPVVGSPWSSKTPSSICRPLMPPAAFHSSMASRAPLSSHAPSELSCPLGASTSATLMGPELSPDDLSSEPGALHPARITAETAMAAMTVARRRNMCVSPQSSGLFEKALVDVFDVPVAGGGYRFVDHRHVDHR